MDKVHAARLQEIPMTARQVLAEPQSIDIVSKVNRLSLLSKMWITELNPAFKD